jgi:hypothetical protein
MCALCSPANKLAKAQTSQSGELDPQPKKLAIGFLPNCGD